jgi:hypothetical protein
MVTNGEADRVFGRDRWSRPPWPVDAKASLSGDYIEIAAPVTEQGRSGRHRSR